MDPTEQTCGNTPTMQTSHRVAGLNDRDLPERTRSVVRLAILDTVGCGIYGFVTPWTQAMFQWVKAGGSTGKARSWSASPVAMRAADAALVNGVSAHAFELDDYHNAELHPAAEAIRAVMALAQALLVCGKRRIACLRQKAGERVRRRVRSGDPLVSGAGVFGRTRAGLVSHGV